MSHTFRLIAVMSAMLGVAGCGEHAASPTAPAAARDLATPAAVPFAQASSSGGTMKEALSGSAINGVVPQGEALADESRFSSGGSTTLVVQVKNVNLPDGTVVAVTFDFTPVGSIVLSGRAGTLTTSLGHFGVSRDQVRVQRGTTTILAGSYFQ